MNIVTRLVLENIDPALTEYAGLLRDVSAEVPPFYGSSLYGEKCRDLAVDYRWVLRTLIESAHSEYAGSDNLVSLRGKFCGEDIRTALKTHATDEARHARMYIAITDLVFPGGIDAATKESLSAAAIHERLETAPTESAADDPSDVIFDKMFQINIVEIRTLVNLLLFRPILLEYVHQTRHSKVAKLLDRLVADEFSHIRYSGAFVNSVLGDSQEPHRLKALALERFSLLNEVTRAEVGPLAVAE